MIKILLYQTSEDLYKYDFSQDGKDILWRVVSPSPQLADIARAHFAKHLRTLEGHRFHAITMARFIQELQEQNLPREMAAKVYGKSKLYLHMSFVWKKFFSEQSFAQFDRAFNLFTDFRSFTLDAVVMDEVMSHFDSETRKSVLAFQALADQLEIYDEHKLNFTLAEVFKEHKATHINEKVILWGFDFLNAAQVELFSEMAKQNTILIPFAKDVYHKSNGLDWIRWIENADAKILDIATEGRDKTFEVTSYPKNYLAKTLKKNQSKMSRKNIFLGTKSLDLNYLEDIPLVDLGYKINNDLFFELLSEVYIETEKKIKSQKNFRAQDLVRHLNSSIEKSVKNGELRKLKVLTLFVRLLTQWLEYQEDDVEFGLFELSILRKVIELDLPRTFCSPIHQNPDIKLQALGDLLGRDEDRESILCISSAYGELKSSIVEYTENVEKYLASLGPIRRADFDYYITTQKINELLFSDQEVSLFIENGILEKDEGWAEIFEKLDYRLKFEDFSDVKLKPMRMEQRFNQAFEKISATRLQSYLDCPLQFYHKYILKDWPLVKLESEVSILDLGNIEHLIIESYLREYNEWNDKAYSRLVAHLLADFYKRHDFKLRQEQQMIVQVELVSKTKLAINALLELRKIYPYEAEFESIVPSLTGQLLSEGRIDMLAKEKAQILIDFKRGSASVPTQKSFWDFEKVQVWFYLLRLIKSKTLSPEYPLLFGYVNLSSVEDSLIFCTDENLAIELGQLHFFGSSIKFAKEILEKLRDYESFEHELINQMQNEKKYLPNPVTASVCQYCSLSRICPRIESEAP